MVMMSCVVIIIEHTLQYKNDNRKLIYRTVVCNNNHNNTYRTVHNNNQSLFYIYGVDTNFDCDDDHNNIFSDNSSTDILLPSYISW